MYALYRSAASAKSWCICVTLLTAILGCSDDSGQKATENLQAAAANGDVATANELLRRNPSLAAQRDSFGLTPLHLAASNGQKAIAELLLENHADPNARTTTGFTPLLSAINANKPEVVELLLEHGADVNLRGADGRSAIDIAQQKNQTAIVELLQKRAK